MLTSRRQSFHPPSSLLHIPDPQHWSTTTIISQPLYNDSTTATVNNTYSLGADQTLFDFQPQHFNSSPVPSLMQHEPSNTSWLSNGQLTPTSATRNRHQRESSLSSLGSAGPASPYTANTSNPQVAGDIYHDFHDFQHPSSKPLTPVHTPSQEHFLASQYSNFYHASNLGYAMGNDGLQKHMGDAAMAALMPAPELNDQSVRPSLSTVASHESPSTPPSYEDERRRNGEILKTKFSSDEYLLFKDQGFRSDMPKLNRTATDAYVDGLYNPNINITTAPSQHIPARASPLSPQNDVFSQRLQAANNQHLSASNIQTLSTIPSRQRSPFREGSSLAPSANGFSNARFSTATHMREQQKAETDAQAQSQMGGSSGQTTPKTISPKDVDLVYHEDEEDSKMPPFPPLAQQQFPAQRQSRQSPNYRQAPVIHQEHSELDDATSQQSFGSMATSRRESSSAFSGSSQPGNFNFTAPAIPAVRQIPQQYPFVPQSRREPSGLSAVSEDFPATLTSMESSSSEFGTEQSEIRKPSSVSADTGTYTCTYHGCTLRFDTPAKLQRHKREGHRSSASIPGDSGSGGGMTSEAQRNSQAGPHKASYSIFQFSITST